MTTFTSLLGGSATGPTSFDPRLFDVLSGEGGALRSRGDVLGYETFHGGSFNGWANHVGYATPYPPIGLTRQVSWGGSDTSLHLSTATRDHAAVNTRHTSTSSYKRHTRPREGGLVSFSAMIAIAGDGSLSDNVLPFSAWGIGIDTQRLDSTWRSFFQVQYVDRGFEENGTTRRPPQWQLRTWNTATGARSSVLIPGSENTTAGLNERKFNPNYVRLTVDLDADGGHGGYREFQINHRVFDLRTLLPAGHDARDLVLKDTSWDDFRGGLNSGLLLSRSTLNPTANNVEMAVGQCLTTVNDRKA